MKSAFLFPGQGSQKTGLLTELPSSKVVENILAEASDALDKDIFQFHTESALKSTKAVQIVLLTAGVATYKLFESEGLKPDFVAGHSVGAFGAAVAAGVIGFADALRIVKLRGELMEKLYPSGFGMGVVLGLEKERVEDLVARHFEERYPVFLANQNAPDQVTVSGALRGIEESLQLALQHGARYAFLLAVNTPSHCPLLSPVSIALDKAFNNVIFHKPVIPYVGNQRARMLFNAEDIRRDLVESIAAPVRWHDATTVLYEKGVRLFIEMIPGNILTRLAEKAFPEARALSVSENGWEDCCYLARNVI